ncbi:core protein [Salmonella enterica subsp. enterica serovar Senftenberg]|uniref:Core protein n=2 Tax=Salmonella enterica I TaxID=59201 RepID=A0A3V5TSD4_SALSE|nr:core protein [Salmonella enterica]AWE27051.1 core protein [Salmonella enterica subsp. enterica serovar Senftenberg]AWE40656.1 core protein [Salmonella enterica subsp. enterica serovar Senftenberg str. 361154004]AZZ05185.1 core protein [Salmonella sp. SSDFZ54]EAW1158813.1 core protein [Salmonella enterica subsp. enterica]EBF1863359.1 core protein [Salmonella enterica subsp. enterica serovar Heidelberg]EBH8107326.1 core protein [Salmonella enterica subsp. enterica serovar Typhimurium str. UK
MSGKPAARQGDMTPVGGPIVQGGSGCADWRADGRGLFGVVLSEYIGDKSEEIFDTEETKK